MDIRTGVSVGREFTNPNLDKAAEDTKPVEAAKIILQITDTRTFVRFYSNLPLKAGPLTRHLALCVTTLPFWWRAVVFRTFSLFL